LLQGGILAFQISPEDRTSSVHCDRIAAFCARAQSGSLPESIEWTWEVRPEKPLPALPNVLLIGDSITRAYFPQVQKDLEGVANVYLMATSASIGDPRPLFGGFVLLDILDSRGAIDPKGLLDELPVDAKASILIPAGIVFSLIHTFDWSWASRHL